ncbi:sensor histidine kinase [Litorilituus sediminis]|uniref:C4-dicarboxylate transport sensor protein DctB n=1 Tax=Litorilituus sediminis TaxID=718192 RepID=A0A4V0ZFP2_9GAMM|nr:ATP-binding protein [Litorilituus sediminis]QBG34490.1 sensor histidine kinase [Litorilituus sediminis]
MAFNSKSTNKNYILSTLVVIGLLLAIELTQVIGLRHAYQQMHQQSSQQLASLVSYIENILGRFEKIPEVLSKHPLLAQVLTSPDDQSNVIRLNQLLAEIRTMTQASDIYLINSAGITVSASNYQLDTSFIGMDFTFRPYFQQAMQGGLSRYYAVGLSSAKRGFYYAYPVIAQGDIVGVIALKISIAQIEQQYKKTLLTDSFNFLIVAPDDVVFISDREEWRLKTIGELSASKRAKIIAAKRYTDKSITALNVSDISNHYLPKGLDSKLLQISSKHKQEQVFAMQTLMKAANWQVHLWSSLAPIKKQRALLIILSACGYLLVVFLLLFANERLKNARRLKQSQQLLEQKVKERTADLSASNVKLLEEIAQRKQAQTQVEKMQEELIQSEKLAVIGSMSAGINHEINQPLTALRSYSENALAYQERNMTDKVKKNLTLIVGLVDRLSDIVSQFNSFSKKSTGVASLVNVHASIMAALSIVKHQAKTASVKLTLAPCSEELHIFGDAVRFEQVLVNLLSNAIQALSEQEDKQVTISTYENNALVFIEIRDNGPGILADNIDRIFEAFFTTKENFGLGLGLSISHRIIESMQGQLKVSNHQEGGAVFTISLPIKQVL